jgi:hypothetical protein
MPTVDDISDYSSDELSTLEARRVRRALQMESTVDVPSADDVTTAIAALDAEGRQEVRALLDEWGLKDTSEVQIDGGRDAAQIDPFMQRWNVRNQLRLALGFDPEPRPAGSNDWQVVELTLGPTIAEDEFA